MKNDMTRPIDLAARLKDLEHFTAPRAPRSEAAADVIAMHDVPPAHVPTPRRSRVFLRHGGGHGAFAEMTLTAPRPRPAHD